MDLGFSGVIEKFEEHWGKRLTRLLLMLVGIAIAAICMGAIWQWLVSPVLAFFRAPLWGEKLGELIWAGVTITFGIAAGGQIVAGLVQLRKNRKASDALLRADAILARTEDLHKTHIAEMRETADMGDAMLSKALDNLREVGATQRRSVEMVRMIVGASRRAIAASPELRADERAEKLADLDKIDRLLREMAEDIANEE